MKTKILKSGLIIGTLSIVAGKGYLSYRNYNLDDPDFDSDIDRSHLQNIIRDAKIFCTKNKAQLWAY